MGSLFESKRASDGSAPPAKVIKIPDRVPVLSRSEAVARLERKAPQYFAFYSSVLGGIVTDPGLFVVPLDDHLLVRGHGVFDTCTLRGGRLYRLDTHLARFEKSIEIARIDFPREIRSRLRDIVIQTALAAGVDDGSVRYWASAGPGNFNVTGEGCDATFYVIVYEDKFPAKPTPIPEVTITYAEVPTKPSPFCVVKSNNYLPNVLLNKAAKDKGGTFGIWVDEDDFIVEACVLGVVAVFADGSVATPPTDAALDSTTVAKVLEEAENDPRWRGKVSRRPIKREELYTAREVMLCAGDWHINPLASLDGKAFTGGHEFAEFVLERIKACSADPEQTIPLR